VLTWDELGHCQRLPNGHFLEVSFYHGVHGVRHGGRSWRLIDRFPVAVLLSIHDSEAEAKQAAEDYVMARWPLWALTQVNLAPVEVGTDRG
jgi:hypothetical protein